MKIAFFENEPWEKEYLTQKLPDHELQFVDGPANAEAVEQVKDCEAISVFIYSKLTREALEKLPNLKLVATRSTGFDHVDREYCKERGIQVCYVPTYGENTVAEHTFALVLALSRKLYPSIRRTHEQHSFHTDPDLRGFDLKGKTIGVIGTGHIGQHVIRMAHGFQMRVIAYDRHDKKDLATDLGFTQVDLDTLYKESDIISLHVPFTEETKHLINAEAMEKMKDGVQIINTARGGVIDTHALVKALESGKVGGAALDVLEEECETKEEHALLKDEFKQTCDMRTLLENHMLMKHDNVVVTPHNAFNSEEALKRILDATIEGINGFTSGNAVNVVPES